MSALCAALIGTAIFAAGVAMAAEPQVESKSPPQAFQFDFKATVQPDGTLADIQPDATLPEAIRVLVRNRVATWRYKPAQWKGRLSTAPIAQTIKAVAIPKAQGGFSLRVEEVTGQVKLFDPDEGGIPRMAPPQYPPDLRRRDVSAVLVYAVLFDEAGKPQQIDLLYPDLSDRNIKRFDKAARDAMTEWKSVHTFEGAPISCRAKVPVTFQMGEPRDPLRVPPEVAASFDKYDDRCPVVQLDTVVGGTFL